jgi:hypothetical protein
MKAYQKIFLTVVAAAVLSISSAAAQDCNPAKPGTTGLTHITKADSVKGTTAPDPTSSKALYDILWKFHTHGYPVSYYEAGIETDGNFIYTTRWNSAGTFYRYTIFGTFVNEFHIPGAGAIRDLAYDAAVGRMYGGAGATTVYEMNFTTCTLVSSFTAPTAVRAIAWDRDLNIFYANNWSTAITKFTKAGVSQGSFACGPMGESYYGFAYCPVGVCTGPKLYGYCQVGMPANTLVEIALPAGTETQHILNISALLGTTTGTAGGLAFFLDPLSGSMALLGMCQNEWIWAGEVCPGCDKLMSDVGILSINTPESGWNLTTTEPVQITVKNFNSYPISNIPAVLIFGSNAYNETIPGTLAAGDQLDFTFAHTVDCSLPGQTYTISTYLPLSCEWNWSNNYLLKDVKNLTGIYCEAGAGTCQEHIDQVTFNTINNVSGCGLGSSGIPGFSDYTSVSTTLQPDITYAVMVHNPIPISGDQCNIWIDWDWDDFDSTDLIVTSTSDYMTFTGSALVPASAINGSTRMRIRLNGTDTLGPCGMTAYGEVEDYTIKIQFIQINLTALLEGPYSGSLSSMSTSLNANGYLPLAQPYNVFPWYYTGTEGVSSLPGSDIVDWVLVELRETTGGASTATPDKMIARKAGFLWKDGNISAADGSSGIRFGLTITGNLFAIFWHRNHLGIMSSIPLIPNGNIYSYDFSVGSGQAFGGANAQKEVGAGVWGMIAGDGNADGQVSNADKLEVWKVQSGNSGYLAGDFNMDAQVNNADKIDFWTPNSGRSCQVP